MNYLLIVLLSFLVYLNGCKKLNIIDNTFNLQEKIIKNYTKDIENVDTNSLKFRADKDVVINGNIFFSVWGKNYETNIERLPKSGIVDNDKIPYSGYSYPEINGGTNAFGTLDKYDRAFGTKAAQWERTNHTRSSRSADADWAGHCNGAASAAQRHKEPYKKVERNGVTFTPQDIKALLAEIYMSSKRISLGGYRCEKTNFPTDPNTRPNPQEASECEDVNPALLHLALSNWIGVVKYSIIMDLSINRKIWNYPVYAYSTNWQYISKSEALSLLGSSFSEYKFNPFATKFAKVTTTIRLTSYLSSEAINYHRSSVVTYYYILELANTGEILGGEWIGSSIKKHPDFIWLSLEPVTPSGDAREANPEINYQEVLKMWAESIGETNPYWGIMEPEWLGNWGKFNDFRVYIDGDSTGAVFLTNKPTIIVIQLTTNKFKGSNLLLYVNNSLSQKFSNITDTKLKHEINSIFGLNTLGFVFKKQGFADTSYILRYYAMY